MHRVKTHNDPSVFHELEIACNMSETNKVRVLFVCMGNICRSPTGEAVLLKKIAERNVSKQFVIDSCGTVNHHIGQNADPRMMSSAQTRGYELASIARQFSDDDFENFDVILAMDRDNYFEILQMDKKNLAEDKLHLLCDFVQSTSSSDVPDPYYGGEQGFDHVLDLIEEGCDALIEKYAT